VFQVSFGDFTILVELKLAGAEITDVAQECQRISFEKLKEETSDSLVLIRARQKFDKVFRYDEQGIPRIWQPGDDLEAQFATARETVHGFLLEI